MQQPQNGRFANSPGSYDLAIRVLRPIINRGDTIELEVYVTGYGFISGPKFLFTLPPQFIDTEHSKVIHGFKRPPEGETIGMGALEFGGEETTISDRGFSAQIGGLTGYIADDGTDIDWGEPTSFWDAEPVGEYGTPAIASEMERGNPPLKIILQTTKQIPSGNHTFQFHLTYFNGAQWQTTDQSANISVQSWFQQYYFVTWGLGLLGALLAIFSLLVNIVANWDVVRVIWCWPAC